MKDAELVDLGSLSGEAGPPLLSRSTSDPGIRAMVEADSLSGVTGQRGEGGRWDWSVGGLTRSFSS
jgi:hypothetical protein